MPTSAVRVKGYRELDATFKAMGRDVQKELRKEYREIGEPIKQAAEMLAVANIRNIGDRWDQMRIGVTSKLVYLAPKARSRGGSPRPNLGGLLMQRAMLPAVAQNEERVVAGFEKMVDRIADKGGF